MGFRDGDRAVAGRRLHLLSQSGSVTEATGWRDHTKDVLATLGTLLQAMLDVETGQRGYLLAGEEDYLEPYHCGMNEAPQALVALLHLTQDNPSPSCCWM